MLDAIIEQTDIDAVALRVGELLDESLVVDESAGLKDEAASYRITQSGKTWDLSKIDFEKLKEEFKALTHKNIEIADLRAFIQKKLEQMLKENATRTDFATRLQGIIDRYNSGSSSADNYFEELVKFTKDLKAESERHIREGLTEDELELFDLIKKDKMTEGGDAEGPARCEIIVASPTRGEPEGSHSGLVQGRAKPYASPVSRGIRLG